MYRRLACRRVLLHNPKSTAIFRQLHTAERNVPRLKHSSQVGYHIEMTKSCTVSALKNDDFPHPGAFEEGEEKPVRRKTLADMAKEKLGIAPAVEAQEPTRPEASTSQHTPAVKSKKGKKWKKSKAILHDGTEATETSGTLSAKEVRAQRTAPSAESGGIPDPTATYLAQSSQPPSTLLLPRRILIILDLNGTLLHRPNKHRPRHFVPRPHAAHFLSYCLSTFHLAIWSSARPENVETMVGRLLNAEQRSKCLLVWARNKFGLSAHDYNQRVQCYKRLETVWAEESVQKAHPEYDSGSRWDQSNTVLVDDSTEKGRAEPYNILALPEFSGLANEVGEVLPQVHDYLNTLSWQDDISRYIRQNPFHLYPKYSLPGS